MTLPPRLLYRSASGRAAPAGARIWIAPIKTLDRILGRGIARQALPGRWARAIAARAWHRRCSPARDTMCQPTAGLTVVLTLVLSANAAATVADAPGPPRADCPPGVS